MRKNFKTIGLLLTMSIILVNFTSCNNNEPDAPRQTFTSIIAENVIGNTSGIATVKLGDRMWGHMGERYTVFAEAPFVNNGFVLNLPEYMPGHVGGGWVLPDDAVVTNRDARSDLREWLEAFDENGNYMGLFFLQHETDDKFYSVAWMYSDRPHSMRSKETIMGSDGFSFLRKLNIELEKGWNLTYFISDRVNRTTLRTMEKPAGVEFRWYFERNPNLE